MAGRRDDPAAPFLRERSTAKPCSLKTWRYYSPVGVGPAGPMARYADRRALDRAATPGVAHVLLRRSIFAATALATLAAAAPAYADWVEVRSTNFRYLSEDGEAEVVTRVENLEKLDKIVRTVTGNKQAPSPLPVTVFELAEVSDVQDSSFGVGGALAYYTTSEQGAHIVTFHKPLTASAGGRLKRTYPIQKEVTQHEYLHHMMFQYFPTNYPTFYPEGFAEYYGTIQFEDDNVIVVGHAPFGRLESMSNWLDVRDMLTAKSYADVSNLSGLYAQGWLLTHMAASRPERGKQLKQYLSAVANGIPYEKAAEDAFGDLDKFNDELRAYRNEVTALTIKLDGVEPGPVEVRRLSPVEEDLVEVELALRSSIKYSELDDLAGRVRSAVDDRAADPYGQGILALTEYFAGNAEAAQAASQRALALEPDHVRGNLVAGMVATDRLKKAGETDSAAWDEARRPFEAAIVADDTATWNLIEYYKSFQKQGVLPSAKAQNAIMRALQLMPSNDELRQLVAGDFEARGMIKDAIYIISPAAFGTFDGSEEEKRRRERRMERYAEDYTKLTTGETPLEMLRRLEAKRDGKWDAASQSIIGEKAAE